jgi:hypothetical protein
MGDGGAKDGLEERAPSKMTARSKPGARLQTNSHWAISRLG